MTPERIEASGYRDGARRPRSTGCAGCMAAGIRIVAGGDFGHQWTHHGTYAAELQRYVELVDMTPVEAIHTATRNTGASRRPATSAQLRDGRTWPTCSSSTATPPRTSPCLQRARRAGAVIKDGQFAYAQPRGLSVTDGSGRTHATAILSGVDALVAPARAAPPARRPRRSDAPPPWCPATPARRWAASTWPSSRRATCSPPTGSCTARASTRSWPRRRCGAARWARRSGTPTSTGWPGAWYGKTPGLDRAGDVLKHANAMGAGPNGGVVMFCGDDPTRQVLHPGLRQPVHLRGRLRPRSVPRRPAGRASISGVHAFRLSRYAGAWVG